ncbi:MAG: 2TM domain-containing protein [Saprospiraceae bacterium]
MKNEDIFEKANKKVKAKKGFFYHFLAYALILGMLYAILTTNNNGEILPMIIIALIWGIGLAAHYLSTFGTENLEIFGISPNWEEDELENELNKLTRKRELKEQIRKEKNLLDDFENLELKEIEKKPLEDDDFI